MNAIPLRPVCLGRLLIDLPSKGVYSWSQSFDGADVSRLSPAISNVAEFWDLVEQRRGEYAAAEHHSEPSLLSAYLKVDERSALILHRESASDTFGYDLERYLWLGQTGYQFATTAMRNEKHAQLIGYTRIFDKVVAAKNTDTVKSPGFCIDGALVTGEVGQITASLSIDAFGMKGVSLSLGTGEGGEAPHADDSPMPTAFDDLKQAEEEGRLLKGDDSSDVQSFETLIKTRRAAGVFKGQLIAYRMKFNNGRFRYRYFWEADTKWPASAAKPGVSIDLQFDDEDLRAPNITPPSEDQMLALFNAVLDSLKPRPGAN